MSPPRWDIFCSVVDNFGDVGVAWRLARQLASEHGIAVRLWVDELRALTRIDPRVDPSSGETMVDAVRVRRWDRGSVEPPDVADVVIEAFGCGVPDGYVTAMARSARPPAWIVVEYLSAEPWVDSRHGLPSPHPATGLDRDFFFPGFSPSSGGLLRERGLLAKRDAFRADPAAQAAFWRSLGVARREDAIIVSLFCYADAPLLPLLDAWSAGDRPVVCVVPDGVATEALHRWIGGDVARPCRSFTRNGLTIAGIAFLTLDDYDRLLWASDVNFVRGEDSFVRAQWAARPLVWNAYAQAGSAHLTKVDAFLDRYQVGLAPQAASALRAFLAQWNGNTSAHPGATWPELADALPALGEHAYAWAEALAQQSDQATALVKFASDRV